MLNSFMSSRLFYLDPLDRSISKRRDVWLICFLPCSAASELGLHCLPVSLIWNARHKWVNEFSFTQIVTQPVRGDTILDLLLTDNPTLVKSVNIKPTADNNA